MTIAAVQVARAFEVMLPARNPGDGLYLSHNPHRDVLVPAAIIGAPPREQTATEWLRDHRNSVEFVNADEQATVEATDTLWLLEWTPLDESAQSRVAAATLSALAQWLQDNGLAFGS